MRYGYVAARWIYSSGGGKTLGFVLLMVSLASPAPAGMTAEAHRLVAVTLLMAALWLTHAIPLAVTSLIPLVAFPLLGIQTAKAVSRAYVNESVFLLLGGFVIALGIEKWGLHRRIALHIIRRVGTNLKRTVLGFMLSTSLLSMWISNTASSLLMLPIAVAFLDSLSDAVGFRRDRRSVRRADTSSESAHRLESLSVVLLLAIAYAATIGGFTTQVGTPANIQFRNIWAEHFPQAPEISAGQWMVAVVPVGIVMLFLSWWVLTWRLPRIPGLEKIDRDLFTRKIEELGPPSPPEIRMLVVFAMAVVLWLTRQPITIVEGATLPGWGQLVEGYLLWLGAEPNFAQTAVGDSTVAIFVALVMFFLPATRDNRGTTLPLMDWETAVKLPWAILLLIGGGFALAGAFTDTGLSLYVGDRIGELGGDLPPWLLVTCVCLVLTFLTEFTSNVATVSALLPILAGTAVSIGMDPRLLMIPATLATTCAFMLPIGTPPNAVIFSSGKVRIGQMACRGFALNLISVLVISTAAFVYFVPRFGISRDAMPVWAEPAHTATEPTSPNSD